MNCYHKQWVIWENAVFPLYLCCLFKVRIWNKSPWGHQEAKFHSVEANFKCCASYFLFMQRSVDSMSTQLTCVIAVGKHLKSNNPVDSIISWTPALRQENWVIKPRCTVLQWMVTPEKSKTSCYLPNIVTFIKLLQIFTPIFSLEGFL